MSTPLSRDDEHEITRVIGLLALKHPDIMDRVSYDELRRMAAEEIIGERRRDEIPAVFLDAFAERPMTTETQCPGRCGLRCACPCGCKAHSHMRRCLACGAEGHDPTGS